MPLEMERELKLAANKLSKQGKLRKKKGDSLEQAKDRFVYGIMRKRGWKPSTQRY